MADMFLYLQLAPRMNLAMMITFKTTILPIIRDFMTQQKKDSGHVISLFPPNTYTLNIYLYMIGISAPQCGSFFMKMMQ